MAYVKGIQVCGGRIFTTLWDAFVVYSIKVSEGVDREKLNFAIILDNGTIKHITFRQEDDGIHVYGDFEGMPNALEWAQRML